MKILLLTLLLLPTVCFSDIQEQLANIQKLQDLLVEKEKAADEQPSVTFDERPVQVLYEEARRILTNKTGPYDKAIENLRSIILSQPPIVAKEAHELLGYAYVKSKMFDKARAQYTAYLNLYTENDTDRIRVRQRLIAIEIREPNKLDRVKKTSPKENKTTVDGSVSEYLLASSSIVNSVTSAQVKTDTTYNQYLLSSNFRFSDMRSLNGSRQRRKTINRAEISLTDIINNYSLILGRQQNQAGAIGRFDGITIKYKFNDQFKLVAAAGQPYFISNSNSRNFYGTELQWTPSSEFSLAAYLNRGTVDGFVERFAIGNSIEYFNPSMNFNFRSEYDVLYKTLNQVSLQTNKKIGDNNFYLLYDRRRSPFLYADSALSIGLYSPFKESFQSINELLSKSGLSERDVYNYISTTTPYANSYVIGFNRRLTDRWNGSFNLQSSNITASKPIGISNFDPIPVNLNLRSSYSLSAHLMGENILFRGNSPEIVMNYYTGYTNMYSVTLADSYKFKNNDLSLILRYDGFSTAYNYSRLTAILRLIFAISENGTLEAQYMQSDLPSGYIGYRYVF